MKRKIIIDAGTVGHWEIVDYTDYYNDIKEIKGEEEANVYFQPGVFDGSKIDEYNGKHFIFGFMESLAQSDQCPPFLFSNDYSINQIIVEIVKEAPKLVKCKSCRFCSPHMEGFTEFYYTCEKEKQDLKQVEDIDKIEVECDSFDSKYIEYPLTISGITYPKEKGIRKPIGYKTGTLVKIRPVHEKYENKTYLGILLGEIDTGVFISHYPDTLELSILRHYNPAIFVPELKEIIFGYESWWGVIKNEEELKAITNEDIDQVWYVQLLKEINNKTKEARE